MNGYMLAHLGSLSEDLAAGSLSRGGLREQKQAGRERGKGERAVKGAEMSSSMGWGGGLEASSHPLGTP